MTRHNPPGEPPQQRGNISMNNRKIVAGIVGVGALLQFTVWVSAVDALMPGTAEQPASAPTAQPTTSSPSPSVSPSSTPTPEPTTATPEPKKTPPPPPPPPPAPKPDPVAVLKDSIKTALGDSNRDDVRRVKVTTSGKAGKPIEVTFAIDDNLTAKLMRYGARHDVVKILQETDQHATWKFSDLIVRGTFSMQDKLGNIEEDQVVFARYSRKTVHGINFENFDPDNVWEVAEVRAIHPEFQ
jgi:hypothetical protein